MHRWLKAGATVITALGVVAGRGGAAASDALRRASDVRAWVGALDEAGKQLDSCLMQALSAWRPETVIDGRYDPEERRLALQFGDGRGASLTLEQLGGGERLRGFSSRRTRAWTRA